MAGRGFTLRSLEPGALRPSKPGLSLSGELLCAETARGALWHLALRGDVAPRRLVVGAGRRQAAALFTIGLVALAVGLLVYLVDRDPSRAALIPAAAALVGGNLFGALGQWLPSFVHPFAFSLFTAATYPSRTAAGYGACVAWGAVNVAFEVAQYPGINRAVAEGTEGAFGRPWPARLLSNYVLQGTFDAGDLVAATAGAVAAALVLYVTYRPKVDHEH